RPAPRRPAADARSPVRLIDRPSRRPRPARPRAEPAIPVPPSPLRSRVLMAKLYGAPPPPPSLDRAAGGLVDRLGPLDRGGQRAALQPVAVELGRLERADDHPRLALVVRLEHD